MHDLSNTKPNDESKKIKRERKKFYVHPCVVSLHGPVFLFCFVFFFLTNTPCSSVMKKMSFYDYYHRHHIVMTTMVQLLLYIYYFFRRQRSLSLFADGSIYFAVDCDVIFIFFSPEFSSNSTYGSATVFTLR